MSAAPTPSAVLLGRIAAALGVPVEVFTDPAAPATAGTAPAVHIATLVFDPDGRRFAAAFPALSPELRRSFADNAEALVTAAASSEDPS